MQLVLCLTGNRSIWCGSSRDCYSLSLCPPKRRMQLFQSRYFYQPSACFPAHLARSMLFFVQIVVRPPFFRQHELSRLSLPPSLLHPPLGVVGVGSSALWWRWRCLWYRSRRQLTEQAGRTIRSRSSPPSTLSENLGPVSHETALRIGR